MVYEAAKHVHDITLWEGPTNAVIVGSAMFAATSGSTIVNAVVFTRIAFPEMIRFGFSKSLGLPCPHK